MESVSAATTPMSLRARAVRARSRSLARSRAFGKDEEGATAVEFAFLALPFIALIFAVIELAVVFFIDAALDHGTAQAGRLIRVGELQTEGGQAQQLDRFKNKICEEMTGLANCSQNLRVDIVKANSFRTASLPPSSTTPPPPPPPGTPASPPPPTPPGPPASSLACSGPSEVVLLRAEIFHTLTLPRQITFLGNDPQGYNRRILTATTAFRNEPFPADGRTTSC